MATTHLVSVEEYLRSAYEPDAEYVEERILLRSVPQKPHSKMQGYLDRTLYALAKPAPFLCAEILSPDDAALDLRTKDVREKVDVRKV
jgi:Uma2 family endonuclease